MLGVRSTVLKAICAVYHRISFEIMNPKILWCGQDNNGEHPQFLTDIATMRLPYDFLDKMTS